MSSAIETHALTRRFGRVLAVDGVSMIVPKQAVYGFLGRNGAGKTTTLKMLLGLLRPSGGRAIIDGIDVSADRIAAARKIGALLEAHGFYGNLSGRENLDLTRRLLGLPKSEIDRVLAVVEMTADANRRVGGYSLGMRQRLGLARAMLGAPPVLILDEPTNGLDPDGIADMRRFLRDLPGRTGATVLLSSHLLSEIEQTASHVGVVHAGMLVLEGELSTLRAGVAARIAVRATDAEAALALVRSKRLKATAEDGEVVITLKPGEDVETASVALNHALVQAGVGVAAIGPRARSLEGLYRQVTAAEPMKEAA
jgi:ABC-2 type transport system ATP-binding protein